MPTITLKGENGVYTFNPEDSNFFIGEGGMGRVFKGTQIVSIEKGIEKRVNTPVAIKVLFKELTKNTQTIEREREGAGIRIKHENVKLMLDFVEQNQIYHIVSEYLEGTTLDKYISKLNKMPTNERKKEIGVIFNSVFNGLEELHKNGVVHRDIDPSNIFITNNKVVKITDFGIAKLSKSARKSKTRAGTVIGKPHYAPPEQFRKIAGEEVDNRSDIYALGITLYETFTGTVPYDGTTDFDVQEKHVKSPLPQNTNIDKSLYKVIQKATSKKQANRYQSVNEFRLAFNALYKKTGQKTNLNSNMKEFRWKNLALILIVISTLLAALSIIFIMKSNNLKHDLEYYKDKASDYESKYLSTENNFAEIKEQKEVIVNSFNSYKNALNNITKSMIEPKTGLKVTRGRDWKWKDQGDNTIGQITEVKSNKWVRVKWGNGETNSYRWGAENSYDLEIVNAKKIQLILRDYE